VRIVLKSFSLLSVVLVLSSASLIAADVAKGKETFEKKCAMCHAKDLKGNPAMAKMFKLDPSALNLAKKDTQDKKDADLITTTTKGKGKMPAQEGKLSADDIANAVAYIRSAASGK
jgi:cytochrome c6